MRLSESGEHAALNFAEHGAELLPCAAEECLRDLRSILRGMPQQRAGVRLYQIAGLNRHIASDGALGRIATSVLGASSRPVRAILFNKMAGANWALGWHQDRTICVRSRLVVSGFGPWTVKDGVDHVSPPFELLSRMMTMRVHLDDVPIDNAPLMVALGSHREQARAADVSEIVTRHPVHACVAKAGDVWIYATPILHASPVASILKRRRVLQIDYSADDLPAGLEWFGI